MAPVILPAPLSSARAWRLTDYASVRGASAGAANGQARITLEQLDPEELWLIDHAAITCSSTTQTTLRLYEDTEAEENLLDGSASGNFDTADWPAGLQVQPSRSLLAVWDGATTGAVATIALQLRRYRKA